MEKIQKSIGNETVDTNKFEATCRDYSKAITETVVKDTSKNIKGKFRNPKPDAVKDVKRIIKDIKKSPLAEGIKTRAADVAAKANDSVVNASTNPDAS